MSADISRIETLHSPEFDTSVNLIDGKTYSNFDRWHILLMLANSYEKKERDCGIFPSHDKRLIKDLEIASGVKIDLNDPAIIGFLEILNLIKYDINTIAIGHISRALSTFSIYDLKIESCNIEPGLNTIIESSLVAGGMSQANYLLRECGFSDLQKIANLDPRYGMDINDKLVSSGDLYRTTIHIKGIDCEHFDVDSNHWLTSFDTPFISSSIEACYKDISRSANLARLINGASEMDNGRYEILIDDITISKNGGTIMSFIPKSEILIEKKKPLVLRNYQFNTTINSDNPEVFDFFKNGKGPFFHKARGRILEQELGM